MITSTFSKGVERMTAEITSKAQGFFQCSVIDAKTGLPVKHYPRQKNLILDQGLDRLATRRWNQMLLACAAGTGTTPTLDLVDGTMSRTGTACTLSGSSYSLGGGDVGKWIKWADGTQAKITAVGSTTTCTTGGHSGTVTAQALTLYRANQTGLATEVKRTATYPAYQDDDLSWSNTTLFDEATGKLTLRRTYDFTAEVGSVNYTELGISDTNTAASNLFSRILLDGVVAVGIDQQLRVRYELEITTYPLPTDNDERTMAVTGWPRPYTVSGIVSTGSDFTVTTSETHHFVAGGKLNLAGIKKPRFTITAASSTGSDFTLTTSASHGLTSGDTIIIEGVTPSGYNGEWVCTAGTTGSTVVVTTTANPGTGTVFGNVRMKEPTTWYDGEWTIASVSGADITVTSALNLGTAAEGTAQNDTKYRPYRCGWGITQNNGTAESGYIDPGIAAGRTTRQDDGYFNPNGVTATAGPATPAGSSGATWGIYDPGITAIQIRVKTNGQTLTANPVFTRTDTAAGSVNGWFNAHANQWGTASGDYIGGSVVRSTYSNGNFYYDHVATFSTSLINGTNIRSLLIQSGTFTGGSMPAIGQAASHASMTLQFNERQRKDSTHRLILTIRIRWDRILA